MAAVERPSDELTKGLFSQVWAYNLSMQESKKLILRAAGFREHFDRHAYFNRTAKKVFSSEIVDDNAEDWLVRAIADQNESWVFYANPAPSEQTKRAFLASIA